LDKEHKTYLIICFLLITVIAYILNWNFEKMADTAITLVSIAVGVYIAAVSALLGSPYAKELKQETDKKKQEIRYWEHCRTILDAQENLAL